MAFNNMDNGGKLFIRISKITPIPSLRQYELTLRFETDLGNFAIPVPFTAPPPKTVKTTAVEDVADAVQIIVGK